MNLDVLIDEQTIYKRIDKLATQIKRDYGDALETSGKINIKKISHEIYLVKMY